VKGSLDSKKQMVKSTKTKRKDAKKGGKQNTGIRHVIMSEYYLEGGPRQGVQEITKDKRL